MILKMADRLDIAINQQNEERMIFKLIMEKFISSTNDNYARVTLSLFASSLFLNILAS